MRRLPAACRAGPEGPRPPCTALPSLPGHWWQAGAPPAPCQPGTASGHTTASALGPPWAPMGTAPCQGGGTGSWRGCKGGRGCPGCAAEPMCSTSARLSHLPASPGLPFVSAGPPHALSPACSLPSPPGPRAVCHTCHHGKGEISRRPSAPARSHSFIFMRLQSISPGSPAPSLILCCSAVPAVLARSHRLAAGTPRALLPGPAVATHPLVLLPHSRPGSRSRGDTLGHGAAATGATKIKV